MDDDGVRLVGHVTLTFSADVTGLAEIGYEIPTKLRGNGLATACVRTICVLTWQHTAIDQIIAHVLPDNTASHRVLEKNGFEKTDEVVKGFLRFTLSRPVQYRRDVANKQIMEAVSGRIATETQRASMFRGEFAR